MTEPAPKTPFQPYKYADPGEKKGQTKLEHYFNIDRRNDAVLSERALVNEAASVHIVHSSSSSSSSSSEEEFHTASMLDASQQAAFDAAMQNHNIFLTGAGGSGKSFAVKHIVHELVRRGRRVRVTSSTGVSAILLDLNATTIHMLFAMGDTGYRSPEAYARRLEREEFANSLAIIRSMNTLVIDEISMVSNDLFAKIDLILRQLRANGGQPFGGVQIILSGDFAQLPQIQNNGQQQRGSKRKKRNPSPPPRDTRQLFQTETWERAGIRLMLLTRDHRQAGDLVYADLLRRARLARLTAEDVDLLKSRQTPRVALPAPSEDVTNLLPTNAAVDQINRDRLSALDATTEHTYTALYDVTATCDTVSGSDKRPSAERPPTRAEVQQLAVSFMNKNRTDSELRLRSGARVMLSYNRDVEAGLANGTLGHVVGFSSDEHRSPIVQFAYRGPPCVVPPRCWKFKDNGMWKGSYEQVPLTLAWAITIHKCVAGSTLVPVHGVGLMRIEQLVHHGAVSVGQKGIELGQTVETREWGGFCRVHTENGLAPVTQVYKGPDKQASRLVLTTAMGHKITCSADHPLRTAVRSATHQQHQDVWTQAGEICEGDVVKLRIGNMAAGSGVLASVPDADLSATIGRRLRDATETPWCIPIAILQGSIDSQCAFIRGLFAYEPKQKEQGPRSVALVNSRTASHVQALMLNVGWRSRRQKRDKSPPHVLQWTPTEAGRRGHFYDIVHSIRYDTGCLFDVYVPGPHSFVANGWVTHNSQGATLTKVVTQLKAQNIRWPGAGYTALSRVRSLNDIWFTTFERGAVWADQDVVAYYSNMTTAER